ncbi:MAG: 8-oxo-dGTP diphosphatase [Planctomycetota bacterium]
MESPLIDMPRQTWIPREKATLIFVVRDERILLIHKKRGIGAGKINGPGGRLDPGETPLQCAVREVQEELLVTPTGLREAGELRFQFIDGYSMLVYVYRADDVSGVPRETDEADPLWTDLNEIPFERMWDDDRYWMPLMLERIYFEGRFVFDGDTLVDHSVQTYARSLSQSIHA